MEGFFNRILRIDLDTETFRYESLNDDLLRRTLGGKGLGVHFLLTENPPGVDPLDPENIFVITVGPVTGTKMWGQSRFGVFSKSPATGGYGESYCGGTLPPRIKGCGVDAIILRGSCPALRSLYIDADGVTFHDATILAGAHTCDAEEHFLKHSPTGAGAMAIGPAGENRVVMACIKADRWRSLGRGGMGAVLGSKNVKGIVFNGRQTCPIADETVVSELIKKVAAKGKESPVTKIYQNFGTPNQVKVTNAHKCFPTRYWQKGYFDKWENISADYMQAHFDVKACGCPSCFLRCTKHSVVREGRHAGLEIEGPEFETLYAIGGINEIDSLEEIAWLNDLCDRYGIDTMSAGNMAGFAIEAYKAGRTDFAIDYNQPDRVAELFRMITCREGLGDLLAQGIKTAAATLCLEHIAIHVKGLEPGGFDPRVLKGMGLSYATSPRGACHLRGTFYKAELSGEMDKNQIEGKARLHIDYEDRSALFDCLILCRFFRDFILWDELQQLITALTGLPLDKSALQRLANDITQRTREYNTREGLDATTDTLPPPFVEQANAEGARLTRAELETMVREYNEIRAGT
ncbi:MAG: aldehyde ferredoxin oxidoreductase family protein [Acidobacteria bacterium]|nr:aldehyde ferredoxin oxidoreductase family protein [Acidobacteriota bacterium]